MMLIIIRTLPQLAYRLPVPLRFEISVPPPSPFLFVRRTVNLHIFLLAAYLLPSFHNFLLLSFTPSIFYPSPFSSSLFNSFHPNAATEVTTDSTPSIITYCITESRRIHYPHVERTHFQSIFKSQFRLCPYTTFTTGLSSLNFDTLPSVGLELVVGEF